METMAKGCIEGILMETMVKRCIEGILNGSFKKKKLNKIEI